MAPSRLIRCLGSASLAALLAAAASFLPGSAGAAERVIGGTAIEVQSAPWTVFVVQSRPPSRFLCTGSIIDATHVLTAAHCVYDEDGALAQPSQLAIEAGISNSAAPLPSDSEQDRAVSSLRVDPSYAWSGASAPDDVAVLALASPLDLSGATASAVALPPANGPYPAGAAVGVAGFGRESATDSPSGALQWMAASVDPQGSCGGPLSHGVMADNATTICASSPTGATCNGDSGAGLVTAGSSPTLVGVVSGGATGCGLGSSTLYTYVGAAEVLDFIHGDDQPPVAPRETPSTFVSLSWQPPLVVGAQLDCLSGDWVGPVSLAYSFLSGSGQVLQTGARTSYLLRPTDLGSVIQCEVAATSPGGTTVEATTPTTAVKAPPPITVTPLAPLAAVRGNTLSLHVSFRAPRGLKGRFGVCVLPPAAVGHPSCTSLAGQQGGRGTFSFVLGFRVEPRAPLGHARLSLDAYAGASSARATASVIISAARR